MSAQPVKFDKARISSILTQRSLEICCSALETALLLLNIAVGVAMAAMSHS